MIPIRFRRKYVRIDGLRKAESIFTRNLRGGLEGLAKILIAAAQKRMRKQTGQSHRGLRAVIEGRGLNMRLTVSNELIQAIVDALGLPAGTFPPFKAGSKIYRWVQRRPKVDRKQIAANQPERTISHLSRRPDQPRRNTKRSFRYVKVEGRRTMRKVKKAQLTTQQRKQVNQSNTERRAFLVARAIYEHGIAGSNWHKKTIEANRGRVQREVGNAFRRAINEINRRI